MAGTPPPVPVEFEDSGFDTTEAQRHDVLLSALDHLLSRTFEDIDRLQIARAANLDAIDAALGSTLTGIDMLYISREPTPISGTSISHASWWAEDAPVPCDAETWLRAAIPEGQRSTTSFAMEQFLKSQTSRRESRNVSRASSANSYKGVPTTGGMSRPGSKQQRTRSPSSILTPITSPSTKQRPRGPPSPDTLKSAEHGLREELEIRRAQAAIAREMEAKDAAEREKLAMLQKQLKGRDYSYDHKGQVVVLNSIDATTGPDAHAPAYRLATPETQPLSPTRGYGAAGAASKRQQVQRMATKTKDRRPANEFKETKSTSQPNALETLSPTPGVTLRQGNQSKSGPAPKRGGAQGANMSREDFERYAAQKAQAAHYAAMQQAQGAAAAAAAERAAAERAAAAAAAPAAIERGGGSRSSAVKGTTPGGLPRSAGGLGPLASLPDALPPVFGGMPKLTPLTTPVSTPGMRLVPPDVNPALITAPDWGAPGGMPGYDIPPALPFVKPTTKLRELEVGRNDMMPRDRANLATISPPRTKAPLLRTGAAGR